MYCILYTQPNSKDPSNINKLELAGPEEILNVILMKFWMINYNKSTHNDPIQIAPAKSWSHQQDMIYGRIRSHADIIVTSI